MSGELLAALGVKVTVAAGLGLLLLSLLGRRSAAERSLVAHAVLGAVLAMPLLLAAAPPWRVEAPAPIVHRAPAILVEAAPPPLPPEHFRQDSAQPAVAPSGEGTFGPMLLLLLYGVPAVLLAALSLVGVARLRAIRQRAQVITDPRWLSALAHAQRRMGFKSGAALLSSADLTSPISWGLVRPTIVVPEAVVGSTIEPEAIIAHELAHVRHGDWPKLLAARAACACFWWNPLVWLLARECHQLREESADDAVLAARVAGPDYAQVLVESARHEGQALLLAAHGVAPGRHSLKRRVTRVLETGLARRLPGLGWRAGWTLAAIAMAVPLAAVRPTGPALALVSEGDRADAAPGSQRLPALIDDSAPAALAASSAPVADPNLLQDLRALADAAGEARRGEQEEPPALVAVDGASVRPAGWPAASSDAVSEFAVPAFSEVIVEGGGQVVLRPGSSSRVRSTNGPIDPGRFSVSGRRMTVWPCTTDCAAGPVELVAPAIGSVAVSGGGWVVAGSGFPPAGALTVAVQAGGTVDLREIAVERATAAVEAGGTILVRPTRSLTAAVTAGGEIVYWGDPAVTGAVAAGGDIRRGGPD